MIDCVTCGEPAGQLKVSLPTGPSDLLIDVCTTCAADLAEAMKEAKQDG